MLVQALHSTEGQYGCESAFLYRMMRCHDNSKFMFFFFCLPSWLSLIACAPACCAAHMLHLARALAVKCCTQRHCASSARAVKSERPGVFAPSDSGPLRGGRGRTGYRNPGRGFCHFMWRKIPGHIVVEKLKQWLRLEVNAIQPSNSRSHTRDASGCWAGTQFGATGPALGCHDIWTKIVGFSRRTRACRPIGRLDMNMCHWRVWKSSSASIQHLTQDGRMPMFCTCGPQQCFLAFGLGEGIVGWRLPST